MNPGLQETRIRAKQSDSLPLKNETYESDNEPGNQVTSKQPLF